MDLLPALDDPWRRLPWVVPLAISIWVGLLFAFSAVLREAPPAHPVTKPIDARLIELPPPTPVVEGIKAGSRAAAPPAHPHPRPIVRHPIPMVHRPIAKNIVPRAHFHKPVAASPERAPVTAKPVPASSATRPAAPTDTDGATTQHNAEGSSGIGSAASGARAIYAPMPTIPDYLRRSALNTVAVARFEVAANGNAQVTLVRPTPNPQLNYLLLATLKRWRFFPALSNGNAMASSFKVRIPIVVR